MSANFLQKVTLLVPNCPQTSPHKTNWTNEPSGNKYVFPICIHTNILYRSVVHKILACHGREGTNGSMYRVSPREGKAREAWRERGKIPERERDAFLWSAVLTQSAWEYLVDYWRNWRTFSWIFHPTKKSIDPDSREILATIKWTWSRHGKRPNAPKKWIIWRAKTPPFVG